MLWLCQWENNRLMADAARRVVNTPLFQRWHGCGSPWQEAEDCVLAIGSDRACINHSERHLPWLAPIVDVVVPHYELSVPHHLAMDYMHVGREPHDLGPNYIPSGSEDDGLWLRTSES